MYLSTYDCGSLVGSTKDANPVGSGSSIFGSSSTGSGSLFGSGFGSGFGCDIGAAGSVTVIFKVFLSSTTPFFTTISKTYVAGP